MLANDQALPMRQANCPGSPSPDAMSLLVYLARRCLKARRYLRRSRREAWADIRARAAAATEAWNALQGAKDIMRP